MSCGPLGGLGDGPAWHGVGFRWKESDTMSSLGLAWRAFWRVWSDRAFAERVRALEVGPGEPVRSEARGPAGVAGEGKGVATGRSDALTLLATLQREARLVDFLMEGIGGYSDAQVGAAVRDIHAQAGAVIRRCFELGRLRSEAEGVSLEVPVGFEPHEFHLTGQVAGAPPYRGVLRHHGWRATKCELPVWSGSGRSAWVVAPAEVEVGGGA